MGSFILHSWEVIFPRDPSFKIVCTQFSFLRYIKKFFCGYAGPRLHRHRSRLSIVISFHVTPTGDTLKRLRHNFNIKRDINYHFSKIHS